MQFTDAERIDWLERMANEPGGLLLHDGSEHGRTGLGLRPGALVRSLREAIDSGLRHERGIEPPRSMSDIVYVAMPRPHT
jgi:hypothetical protein